MLSFNILTKSAIININGKAFSVSATHAMYDEIISELKKGKQADENHLLELIDVSKLINAKTFGKVSVTSDSVFYRGKPVGNALTKRILVMLAEGYDIEPWALFMDNVMLNPVVTAREELYRFLESAEMPITPDGHFLAFKNVRPDLLSHHDGKTQHVIGQELSLPMNMVDTNYRNQCSSGLHFCSESYLSQYAGGGGVVLVLKINPKDVVAIPEDYNNAKGRAWRYTPIAILGSDGEARDPKLSKPVVGEVNGNDTWQELEDEIEASEEISFEEEIEETVEVKPKKGVYYNNTTAKKFLRNVKSAGGGRPFAALYNLPRATVQGWIVKARSEV